MAKKSLMADNLDYQPKSNEPEKMGMAGKLAAAFAQSRLTPVIAVASILMGIMATLITPKEEEPQISVPMIDVMIPAPGSEPREVERKITEVVERSVWGLEGVEYVYSTSMPHFAMITVRFKVGDNMETSLVKVHHKIMEIRHLMPKNAMDPEVKAFSIDDVPFLALSFHSNQRNDYELRTLIAPLARELSSTPDLSRVEMMGGLRKAIRIIVDPTKASGRGVSTADVARALQMSDAFAPGGKNWSETAVYDVELGGRLNTLKDIENIAVGQRGGTVVRIKDIAYVIDGPEERTRISYLSHKKEDGTIESSQAVTVAFAKRKGTNVVTLASDLLARAETFTTTLPPDVKMEIIRNYGDTARGKFIELIEHLLIAVISVGALIALMMGLRSAAVVSIAIPVTLALALSVYYFLGYTLNRVTLFALIFSIGILVDDAIVVVENVERHMRIHRNKNFVRLVIDAVAEVGNPTILATFTVIAAVMPMAFVRGLMGPYMKPIPVGASVAMIFSLFVAFIVTPWASVKLLAGAQHHDHDEDAEPTGMLAKPKKLLNKLIYRIPTQMTQDIIDSRKRFFMFVGALVASLVISMGFFAVKLVRVKMLPFDNKNEFQVLLDYPTTTPLATNAELSKELASQLLKDPDVLTVQSYSGEAAPYSFLGMVKHTFMRRMDYMTDLQVVLKDKGDRSRSSHQIITELRPVIAEFSKKHNVISKVLEIPPGPPVMATMVAEIYGPTEEARVKAAADVRRVIEQYPDFVDIDVSYRPGRERLVYQFDPVQGGVLGVPSAHAVGTGYFVFNEASLFTIGDVKSPEDVPIMLSVSQNVRSGANPLKGQKVMSFESGTVDVDRLFKNAELRASQPLFRKNLKPVVYVFSELTGDEEAPVYGILKVQDEIPYQIQTAEVPWDTREPIVKWDGEWFITYEVFRDLGAAFAAVLVLIYIFVLGWFRSYTVPLLIMAPIPISLLGIIPGHWLTGTYFTATSMIGFIAGAGIIVRNSIILVDFIEQRLSEGADVKWACIEAGVVRYRPMILTAAAVIVGTAVILFDPIFSGLAVSLMFGSAVSTILSRVFVPAMYYWFIGDSRVEELQAD